MRFQALCDTERPNIVRGGTLALMVLFEDIFHERSAPHSFVCHAVELAIIVSVSTIFRTSPEAEMFRAKIEFVIVIVQYDFVRTFS